MCKKNKNVFVLTLVVVDEKKKKYTQSYDDEIFRRSKKNIHGWSLLCAKNT